MKKNTTMKTRLFLLGVVIIFLLFSGVTAQSTQCGRFDKKIKYKVLAQNILPKEPSDEILLAIYVKSNKFTVDYMMNLIQRIKVEFCKFDIITVAIYDNKKLYALPDSPHPERDPSPRGFFDFYRKEGKQEFSFLAKKDGKDVETEITFTKKGYCVSETVEESK